jgi:hypothetical protein
VVVASHEIADVKAPTLLREIGRMLPKARLALLSEGVHDDLDDSGIRQLRQPLASEQLLQMLRAAEADLDSLRAVG